MKYFFDHMTDTVSFELSDAICATSETPMPDVVLYIDVRYRPTAIEIRNASKVLDTKGLAPMQEQPITAEEISLRMSSTTNGQLLWRLVVRKMLVPHFSRQRTSPNVTV